MISNCKASISGTLVKRLVISFLFTFLNPINVSASSNELAICSGKSPGLYFQVGASLSGVATSYDGLSLKNIQTNGSADNMLQLEAGSCDFAIIQVDAAFSTYESENVDIDPEPAILDHIVDSLYLEPIHFLVRAEDSSTNIENILNGGKVHGWRAESGHYSTAVYLCKNDQKNSRCDGWPAHESRELSDHEVARVVSDSLLEEKEISAIVFTAGAGHEIVGELIRTNGINLINAKDFPFRKYPFYFPFRLEAGTYLEKNKGKSDKYADTFATLAVLVSNPSVSCQEIDKLRNRLSLIRKEKKVKIKEWISILNQPSDTIQARECT